MSRCKDREAGVLLHAYELGLLSGEERDIFEVHILKCDYCFSQVQEFRPWTAMLVPDGKQQQAAMSEGSAASTSKRLADTLKRYLWPDFPILLRPAISYLLVLLLLIPAYYWLLADRRGGVRRIETIELTPVRSAGGTAVSVRSGRDLLLSFVLRGAEKKEYEVALIDERGREIFRDNRFGDFDEYGVGLLLWPDAHLKPGTYRLTITDPDAGTPSPSQEYRFRIVR